MNELRYEAFECYKCHQIFRRLTNQDYTNRIACFYGDCEGWMYPMAFDPDDYIRRQQAKAIRTVVTFLFWWAFITVILLLIS